MLKWYKQNCVFFWTLLIAIDVIIFGAAYSSILGEISGKFMSWVSHYFGWLYILSIVAFIGFCVWIAMSKYGKIKLGKNDDKPEFGTLKIWMAPSWAICSVPLTNCLRFMESLADTRQKCSGAKVGMPE